jgi:hypothetical protein
MPFRMFYLKLFSELENLNFFQDNSEIYLKKCQKVRLNIS